MKRSFSSAVFAAAAIASAGIAQAVPIHFEFTGVVRQASATTPDGTAVSGALDFDTDRLLFAGSSGGIQYSFIDWQPADLAQPLGSIDFAGTHHEVPNYSENYALLNFVDGCQPLCNTGWAEDFNLSAYTEDPWSPGYTGQLRSSSIQLFNLYETVIPDFPYYQEYDAFDGATAVPLDVMTLPLGRLDGTFTEGVSDCVDGNCTTLSYDYFVFDVTSLTRSFGTTASVPEPGTLGLLGIAALGMLLFRRGRLLQR